MKMVPFYKFKKPDINKETPLRGIMKMDGFVGMVILAVIAIAIIGQVGPAAVAPAITSSSDTNNITGYSTWSSQAQGSYKATGANLSLVWFIIPFILLMALVKGI